MRLVALVAFAAMAVGWSCSTPPTPPPRTPAQVADVLVDAGCLAPGDGDTAAVAAELATQHDPWLGCLQEGGTIAGCNAPCERAGYVRRAQ